MKTIWKFEIEQRADQVIELPDCFEILDVQMQQGHIRDTPCFWALIDTTKALVKIRVRVYGTGHHIPENECKGTLFRYIGTFQLQKGSYIFHVFIQGD